MTQSAFQFIQHKTHLEHAVDKGMNAAPRGQRPVTGWISQKSASSRGCLALWSQRGIEHYAQSGLLGWQVAVVQSEIKVREVGITGETIYADHHQTVVLPSAIQDVKVHDLGSFLARYSKQIVRHEAVVYITSGENIKSEMLLVRRSRSAAMQIPSITFDREEPHREATLRCLRDQCGLDGLSPVKIGIQYNYDFSVKEFTATHYYHGLMDRSSESCRHSYENSRPEYSWCPVTEASRELPASHRAKLRDLIS